MLTSCSGARRLAALAGIAALGCGGSDSAGPNPSQTGFSISGTVVDACLTPVPNVRVWVRGGPGVHTDENGAFSFEGVPRPFDIGYVFQGANFDRIRIFSGVTRTSVRLVLPEIGVQRSGTVTGRLTGTDVLFPVPNLEQAMIKYSAGHASVVPAEPATASESDYSLQANWCGPAADVGNLFALQWSPGFGGRTPAYRAFGSVEGVPVQADALNPGQDILMTTMPTGRIAGSVTLPAGFTVSRKAYGLSVRGAAVIDELGRDESADAAFDLPVPEVDGGTISLVVEALDGLRSSIARRRGLAPGTTEIDVPLAVPPVQTTPQSNAMVDPAGLQFGWSPSAVGLYGLFLAFEPARAEHTTYYQIYSATPNASLPPTDSLPIPQIPPGWSGRWRVVAFSESSVDALLDPASPVGFAGEPNLPYRVSTGRPLTEVRSETRFLETLAPTSAP